MAKSGTMKLWLACLGAVVLACSLGSTASAQAFARSPAPAAASDATKLDVLAKKIEEQNAKIDLLSQQILKLEQQLANSRPGVMVGEGAPATSTSASTPAPQPTISSPANGSSHVVARGETLTSIAKMHNVSVSDLQKFNHIDNPLKLQAGQTIMIPNPSSSSPSPSTSGE